MTVTALPSLDTPIAFIGGGNMASALIGGLLRQGLPAAQLEVVEPFEPARAALAQAFGVTAQAAPSPALARARLVLWAVKPQTFAAAAREVRTHAAPGALHLSVAAGITTDSIAHWLGSERIVRAMPNTPALVGRGMTGLYARPQVDAAARALVEQVLEPTGQLLWLQDEAQLDAVTALSGSGPAYVFLFLEAMARAGTEMGLTEAQARQLALATFQGASELAARSGDAPALLRQRVTSPGGTTHAAISHMQQHQVPEQFIAAMHAAQARAQAMAAEFGKDHEAIP
ncbi:pyrroline-5-carboxylate reductase [Oryzisolibacter propanilivorax]|uniref:Pyrroline-5-carboxylate reductase n=1 Tax=Oryzisolibacter propanilivorax TaxID=1527607 RepID=A0A1G9SF63_9BURK|nr:pyrroline-5-carboxylate reductase [Oryzisolibacter propanilivorax]SDM33425.1 pyrroline-5-carboxylate reductase [Oryzisolibacter propanilivorax]